MDLTFFRVFVTFGEELSGLMTGDLTAYPLDSRKVEAKEMFRSVIVTDPISDAKASLFVFKKGEDLGRSSFKNLMELSLDNVLPSSHPAKISGSVQ